MIEATPEPISPQFAMFLRWKRMSQLVLVRISRENSPFCRGPERSLLWFVQESDAGWSAEGSLNVTFALLGPEAVVSFQQTEIKCMTTNRPTSSAAAHLPLSSQVIRSASAPPCHVACHRLPVPPTVR